VASGKKKARFLVAQKREGRRFVAFKIVAAVTSIEVRRSGKLPGVTIAMTVRAPFKFDLEKRSLAPRDVALSAFQPGVPALQRVSSRYVFFYGKCRWLPPVHVMAGRAFALIRPLGELPIMRIGLVTIHALLKSQRLLKVAFDVALSAIYADVLSFERKPCRRMIKALVYRAKRNFLPTSSAVARLATLDKTSAMRIFMTIRALIESDSRVSRLIVWSLRMALGALDLSVQTGERISRLRVIKLADADYLPVFEVVALLAGCSETSIMRVLMTTGTRGGQAQICAAQILDSNSGTFLWTNTRGRVAAIATDSSVLAL
jgi:hypothetical protein